jgi:hypothetical protein
LRGEIKRSPRTEMEIDHEPVVALIGFVVELLPWLYHFQVHVLTLLILL